MSTGFAIPDGFEELPAIEGFSRSLQPLYSRVIDDELALGFVATEQHINGMGMVHGGALMTIADVLSARCIWLRMKDTRPLVTVSLNYNFIRAIKKGTWIEAVASSITLKRTAAFINGEVLAEQKPAATFSGVFLIPDNPDVKITDEFRQRVLKNLK